jgi:hypothetical protein
MPRLTGFAVIDGSFLLTPSSNPAPPNPSFGGEPGPISKLYRGLEPEEAYVPCDIESGAPTGITEVALEETSCYGLCPTYTLILRADGSVSYLGQANVELKGERTGRIDPALFDQLARLAADIGFFSLEDFYACAVTDHPTTFVSLLRNGERKTIKHYAPEISGPPRLRWFEDLIRAVVDRVEWD